MSAQTTAPTDSPTLAAPAGGSGLSGVEIAAIVIGAGLVISLLIATWANKYKITEEEANDKVAAEAPTKKEWNTEEERVAHMQQKMNESLERRSADS